MLTELLVGILIHSAAAQSGLPVFDTTHEDVSLNESHQAEIWCNASGDTPIDYRWHDKNNEQIDRDETKSVYFTNTSSGSSMIFNVSELYHSGLYTCSAENRHGLVSKVYNISVYPAGNRSEDESVTIESVYIGNVTDSSVNFFITASGNPLVYVVRYTEKIENITRTVIIPAGESIEVTGLVPSGSYKFQFTGQTAFNFSKGWSRVYEVVLLPAAPEVIYRSLGDGALKIEWFRKWDDYRRATFRGYKLSYSSVSMVRGNDWEYRDCAIEVYIPFCAGTSYTVAGLLNRQYYEIRLAVGTVAGFGKPTKFKVYLE